MNSTAASLIILVVSPFLIVENSLADEAVQPRSSVNDFRFPVPGQVIPKTQGRAHQQSPSFGNTELNSTAGALPEADSRLTDSVRPATVINSKGGVQGRSDSLGQAIAPGGQVLGPVDSLGRVITPGTGAIGGTKSAGQRGGSPFK